MHRLLTLAFILFSSLTYAQQQRWQQAAKYTMDIDLNVNMHQYAGNQVIEYTNNSPESLDKIFYHLFFNAFQPGSMMDVRSRTIEDPDSRVGDRIFYLTEDQQGWIQVKSLKMDGKKQEYQAVGTILEVSLRKAIEPGQTVKLEMTWDAQVPLQVRRSGWNNKEGIEYSMTQWYPRLCEYDYEGWHANPYVGREFHGIWGDFDVNITAPSNYVIAGTGILMNADEIGYGYSDKVKKPEGASATWKFKAQNVIDFAWAADPDYIQRTAQVPNGPLLRFFYQPNSEYNDQWNRLPEFASKAFELMNDKFGKYPYEQYSIIQGGDGGMEYPMATLITGNRNLRSLVGVTVHEAAHSWYQGTLASNESLYEWMDEGFTSYATSVVMDRLFEGGLNPHHYAYQGYYRIVSDEMENPLSTHADHYTTNRAYGTAAYSKGEVLVAQLGYIIGNDIRDEAMIKYYDTWKFKHPNPNDFKRIMEMESGLELDWYFQYFVNTTHSIDYGVKEVIGEEGKTTVILEKVGLMPMPLDVVITKNNGDTYCYNIPLQMMRGNKDNMDEYTEFSVAEDWAWTHPEYALEVPFDVSELASINIDPMKQMADIDKSNNILSIPEGVKYYVRP